MKKESLIQVMLLIASLAAPGMASDYLLDIFGNANLDQDIDEKDAAYVEGIIKGTNPATNLSDANYDGKIDAQDIDHINRIILGEETELTLVDSLDRIVTVKKPINHAVVGIRNLLEMFQTIHVDSEHISGITASSNAEYNNLFLPDYIDIPAVGSSSWNLDIEAVLNQHPDVVFLNR